MTDYLQILRKYWGYNSFRGIQQKIIESIGSGRDTLGLMPTGGGKSITFQVPGLAQSGLCLVITPLIALMKDQVNRLHSMGIKAAAIYSGMTHEQILVTLENCIFGDFKFLYVSPERLKSDLFQIKLRHMNISFITVDEAHCISQWGYDFRPSYLEISVIRQLLPGKPVLALTATATPRVVTDIQNKLQFIRPNVFKMSFERKNLAYIVQHTEDKPQELLNIFHRFEGSAIVYTRNRDKTRETANWLTENGIDALHYHAGLDNTDKDLRQSLWQKGEVRTIVATNAFGMGIDKADVRLVVHLDVPDSPEAYFQEAGRAGRDGKDAFAFLLYNRSDRTKLLKRIQETFPSKKYIKKVYEDISSYYQMAVGDGFNITYEFNEPDFCTKFKYFPVPLESALKILTRANYLNFRTEDENNSRIMFLLQKEELYKLHHLTPQNERLIQAILRQYGGIFSQYVVIEERSLAEATGLDIESIYMMLKSFNQQRILHYIPRKIIPHITFTTRRVDTDEINLTDEIYEKRKKEYEGRINAMLNYAESENNCRSRMLLGYFGERAAEDCGKCDVCERRHHPQKNQKNIEHAAEGIAQILSDGRPHLLSDLHHQLPFPSNIISEAVQCLVQDEEVKIADGTITLK